MVNEMDAATARHGPALDVDTSSSQGLWQQVNKLLSEGFNGVPRWLITTLPDTPLSSFYFLLEFISATERFIRNTRNTSTRLATAATQKTSK